MGPRGGQRRQFGDWMEEEEGEGQFRIVETLLEPERLGSNPSPATYQPGQSPGMCEHLLGARILADSGDSGYVTHHLQTCSLLCEGSSPAYVPEPQGRENAKRLKAPGERQHGFWVIC